MATTREIVYRLIAEPDPKYKKVFSDFSKEAVKAQETITKAAQKEGKVRTDSAEKELAKQKRAEDAANKQRQRDADRATRDAQRELDKQTRDVEKAERYKHKLAMTHHRERMAENRELGRKAEERAKIEVAAQRSVEAAQANAAAASRRAYKDMAEGSVRAGEGMMRLVRAAVLLGGEDENMKKFVEQLRKAQGYFDLYKGVVDIVMGLSKAYRAVAAAAAAAAAAQAASAAAGGASTATGVSSAASNVAAGAAGGAAAAKAPGLLRGAMRFGKAGIIALGAGTILDRIFNKGRISDSIAEWGGNYAVNQAQEFGLLDLGQDAVKRGQIRFNASRAQQQQLEEKYTRNRDLNAPIEEAMRAASLSVFEAKGAAGFDEQKKFFNDEIANSRGRVRELQGDRAAGKPVSETEILDTQQKIVDLTKQKLAVEQQIRQAKIEGIEKELEGSKQSLANARQRVEVLMESQRSMEERWIRMTGEERQRAVEAAKAVRAGTATAEQLDSLRGMGADVTMGFQMRQQTGKLARGAGIREFLDAIDMDRERDRAIDRAGKAQDRTLTLDNQIKVNITADVEEMAALVATVLAPEMEKVKSLIQKAEARGVFLGENRDIKDETSANGGNGN